MRTGNLGGSWGWVTGEEIGASSWSGQRRWGHGIGGGRLTRLESSWEVQGWGGGTCGALGEPWRIQWRGPMTTLISLSWPMSCSSCHPALGLHSTVLVEQKILNKKSKTWIDPRQRSCYRKFCLLQACLKENSPHSQDTSEFSDAGYINV